MLRYIDMYRKIPADLMENTAGGGIMSISVLVLLIVLVLCEVGSYLSTNVLSNVVLESSSMSPNTAPHGSSPSDRGSWRYGQMMLEVRWRELVKRGQR